METTSASDEQMTGLAKKIKCKQSAAQMACLVRYLNLIMGDLVPSEYKPWRLYFLLRKIVGIVTAPRFVEADLTVIANLIDQFLRLYISMYGPLKPKYHFLTHVPRNMQENGPLVHYWGMPFERRHVLLKGVADATNSCRNLPITMGIRNNLQLTYTKESYNGPKSDTRLGPTMQNDVKELVLKLKPEMR